MSRTALAFMASAIAIALATLAGEGSESALERKTQRDAQAVTVRSAVAHDVSRPLSALTRVRTEPEPASCSETKRGCGAAPPGEDADAVERSLSRAAVSAMAAPAARLGAAVEQTSQGARPAALLLESFDGQGFATAGPHGTGG
ncbi:MAG: hypothetical protein ACREMQ_01275, partial [Longimicrobiales bacterium]